MIDVRGTSNLQCAEQGVERGDPVVIEILSSDFELHRYGRRHGMILEGCRWVAHCKPRYTRVVPDFHKSNYKFW